MNKDKRPNEGTGIIIGTETIIGTEGSGIAGREGTGLAICQEGIGVAITQEGIGGA